MSSAAKSNDTEGNNENIKLLELINSKHFTLYNCIELIVKHSDNIGIHYYLCQRLIKFPHNELQFYIPQLVHILLTIETESMALEDLLLQLKNENPHFALLTFWQLQALLTDLSTDPQSYGFQVARRVLNTLQSQLFNTNLLDDNRSNNFDPNNKFGNNILLGAHNNNKMHENVAPAIMYSTMLMSCMALPQMATVSKPLIESQGRRQKAYVFKIARNAMKQFTKNITLKNTTLNRKKSSKKITTNISNTKIVPPPASNANRSSISDKNNSNGKITHSNIDFIDSETTKEDVLFKKPKAKDEIFDKTLDFSAVDDIGNQVFEQKISSNIKLPKRKIRHSDDSFIHKSYSEKTLNVDDKKRLTSDDLVSRIWESCDDDKRMSMESSYEDEDDVYINNRDDVEYTNSMPNLHDENDVASRVRSSMSSLPKKKFSNPPKLARASTLPPSQFDMLRAKERNNLLTKNIDIEKIPTTTQIKLLKTNYFRCETQFAIALESISQRLAQVPAEARISALRAELSLMNRDLPAEVDIPTLLPPNKKGKLHKLVSITANEAQVLNSAEKVPYLLLIEYLRDEFDFDPSTESNKNILRKSSVSTGPLFDLNYLNKKELNKDDFTILKPSVDDSLYEKVDSSTSFTDSTISIQTTSDGNNNTASNTNNKNDINDAHHNKNNTLGTKKSYPPIFSSPLSNGMDDDDDDINTITKNTGEMDLGDFSMIKIKNQTEAENYRKKVVIQNAKDVPVIPTNSFDRDPELRFTQNFDEIIDTKIKKNKEKNNSNNNNGTTVNSPLHTYNKNEDLADQMRISALMLAQLDESAQAHSETSNQIREQIIASMKDVQDKFGYSDLVALHGTAGERRLENDLLIGGVDTSYLGESWQTKKERLRQSSRFGHNENWDLFSVIAKCGDDLRQEAFACQLIQAMAQIWVNENVDVWVKKMKILITSATTGLVETITNASSVHSIKKSLTKKMIEEGYMDEKAGIATLSDHFLRAFGYKDGFKYKRAQDNFACSLAAYSLICYILRVKDRHNGNIMIDSEGHVCHIDFGFMLSNSPGSVGFEAAPFKLTYEYVDVLGGLKGEPYLKFVQLMKDGFKALRKNSDMIISMCEIMQKDNMQPCFEAGDQTSVQLKQRFHLDLKEDEVDDFVENFLIGKSLGSVYTRLYDQFQVITQGIFS